MPHLAGLTYDPGAAGGCTIVEVDRDGNRISERVGVASTSTNCAGGETPWDTWLTCEETEQLATPGTFEKDHGYVFEVDPFDDAANRDPQPIKALGRFSHEAVAVDRRRDDVCPTEDAAGPTGRPPPACPTAGRSPRATAPVRVRCASSVPPTVCSPP